MDEEKDQTENYLNFIIVAFTIFSLGGLIWNEEWFVLSIYAFIASTAILCLPWRFEWGMVGTKTEFQWLCLLVLIPIHLFIGPKQFYLAYRKAWWDYREEKKRNKDKI